MNSCVRSPRPIVQVTEREERKEREEQEEQEQEEQEEEGKEEQEEEEKREEWEEEEEEEGKEEDITQMAVPMPPPPLYMAVAPTTVEGVAAEATATAPDMVGTLTNNNPLVSLVFPVDHKCAMCAGNSNLSVLA